MCDGKKGKQTRTLAKLSLLSFSLGWELTTNSAHRELCCSSFVKDNAEDLLEQYGGKTVSFLNIQRSCLFLCKIEHTDPDIV